MKITTTGRKVALKEQFVARVEKRMKKLDKFFTDEATAQVTVTVEKERQTVEITIRDGSFVSRGEKTDRMMEYAFDEAADLLQRKIIKNRKRLGDKILRSAVEDYMVGFSNYEDEEYDDYEVIKEKTFSLTPQTVEEAILEMNMLGHSFFVFKDMETHAVQVVYSRTDGSYGLLKPN